MVSNTHLSTSSFSTQSVFEKLVDYLAQVIFWDPIQALGIEAPAKVPIVVLVLVLAAVYFTFQLGFPNIKYFLVATRILRGKYPEKNTKGETSHFQALATALSATVGLGNISGVAVAISLGGPGACFWMIVGGIFGMTSKLVECTLGVKYRMVNANGEVFGGPMYYLKAAFANKKYKFIGRILAVLFAILCVGGSIGGGNMLQANQAFALVASQVPMLKSQGLMFGLFMALLTGFVIVGGIQSIARITSKLVPLMGTIYVLAGLTVVFINFTSIPSVFILIMKSAFQFDAVKGGFLGVMMIGLQRACFSNEAGIGSASIAHATAKTNFPASEGLVALLEPFIDTVIICTITALVIIFSGVYNVSAESGAVLTSQAFASQISWFPYVLTVVVFLFAFSTMISWSYYGLKAWNFLFGYQKWVGNIFKFIFLSSIIVGTTTELKTVMEFSDMMILAMAFPNIIGLILLLDDVKLELKRYFSFIEQNHS